MRGMLELVQKDIDSIRKQAEKEVREAEKITNEIGRKTMKGLGEAVYIVWASFGVEIEKINESVDNLEIFISVPKSSYRNDVHSNEMAGDYLAKRFKDTMKDIGVKRLTVRYRVRNEHWTEQMYKDAIVKAKQTIYGSQW